MHRSRPADPRGISADQNLSQTAVVARQGRARYRRLPRRDTINVMTTTRNTTATWIRRLMAGAVLAAAPALIALGPSNIAHADVTSTSPGPSMHAPTPHPAFPNQSNMPQPGTRTHHHHQNRHR